MHRARADPNIRAFYLFEQERAVTAYLLQCRLPVDVVEAVAALHPVMMMAAVVVITIPSAAV